MAIACTGAAFFNVFKNNMTALGLDVPSSILTTPPNVVARISAMIGAAEKLGKEATVGEIIGATTVAEKLLVVTAIYASYWLGAAVGSLMVAYGEYLDCGTTPNATIKGVRDFTAAKGMRISPQVLVVMQRHPEIFDTDAPGRRRFVKYAMIPSGQRQAAGAR